MTFLQVPLLDHLAGSGAPSVGDAWQNIVNLNADRTGQWLVIARMTIPAGTAYGGIELFIAGSSVKGRDSLTNSGNPVSSGTPQITIVWQGFANAGTVFRLDMLRWSNSSFLGTLDAYFIPTPANRA